MLKRIQNKTIKLENLKLTLLHDETRSIIINLIEKYNNKEYDKIANIIHEEYKNNKQSLIDLNACIKSSQFYDYNNIRLSSLWNMALIYITAIASFITGFTAPSLSDNIILILILLLIFLPQILYKIADYIDFCIPATEFLKYIAYIIDNITEK